MPREINSVGVVGGGLMGAGIAEVSAVAGMPVVVRDLPQFLDAAQGRVEKSLAGAVKRGKIDQAKRDEVIARITFTPDLKDVADADIVIEAVPEILDLKVSLIKELDELVSPGNVIATNTSSIPIAELAGKVQHPGRVVGVHFFSPVPVMKLVEIVVALDTDPEMADLLVGNSRDTMRWLRANGVKFFPLYGWQFRSPDGFIRFWKVRRVETR